MTVVGLEAWCDYVTEREHRVTLGRRFPGWNLRRRRPRHPADFQVREFALLDDGRRLMLRDDHGFVIGQRVTGQPGFVDPWPGLTLERLETDVRNTVLPDEDETGDEHPWEWLVERLRSHGVDAAPDDLKHVPYDVVFSDRLRARVTT